MKITDYHTIGTNDIAELDKRVREMIADGWQPYGSPYHSSDVGNWTGQAMVKYAPGGGSPT